MITGVKGWRSVPMALISKCVTVVVALGFAALGRRNARLTPEPSS